MGNKNTSIKRKMIAKYGAECWIDKLFLRPDSTPIRYKSKSQMKRMRQLTYHHIKKRVDGGKATEANGAILSAENHAWFHQQPKEIQDKLNQIFQEYKRRFNQSDGAVSSEDSIKYDIVLNYDKFISKARSYSRTKKKKVDREIIEEGLDDYYEGEEL